MANLNNFQRCAVGDLVAFHFPYKDGGGKTRICAIVSHDPDLDEVVVVYGTSNLRLKNNPDHAVSLFAERDWSAAGLHDATRFQVDRRVRVKLSDPRFKQRQSLGTAKVGRLTASQTRQLCAIYKRLPIVTRWQESNGIHPNVASQRSRPSFLSRPKPGQRVAAIAA